jgi:hypothetical protein
MLLLALKAWWKNTIDSTQLRLTDFLAIGSSNSINRCCGSAISLAGLLPSERRDYSLIVTFNCRITETGAQ